MIRIELITSGCEKCTEQRDELKATANEIFGDQLEWRDVNVFEELDYAVQLGILTLPALAINGKLVFASLPTADELRMALVQRSSA